MYSHHTHSNQTHQSAVDTLSASLSASADHYVQLARHHALSRTSTLIPSQPQPSSGSDSRPERLIALALACLDAQFKHLSESPPSTQSLPATASEMVANRLRVVQVHIEFVSHHQLQGTPAAESHAQDALAKASLLSVRLPVLHPLRPLLALTHARFLLSLPPPRPQSALPILQAALDESIALGSTAAAYSLALALMAHLPWPKATDFWRTTLLAKIASGMAPTVPVLTAHATVMLALRALTDRSAASGDSGPDVDAARTLLAYYDSVQAACAAAQAPMPPPIVRLAMLLKALLALATENHADAFAGVQAYFATAPAEPQQGNAWSVDPSSGAVRVVLADVGNAPRRPPNEPVRSSVVVLESVGAADLNVLAYLITAVAKGAVGEWEAGMEAAQHGYGLLVQGAASSRLPELQGILLLYIIDLGIGMGNYPLVVELLDLIATLPTPPPLASLHLTLGSLFHVLHDHPRALTHYNHILATYPSTPAATAATLAISQILLSTPDAASSCAVAVASLLSRPRPRHATPLIAHAHMLKVVATPELVARKQALLGAMDKTRAARASVQAVLLALAGWVYASSHAVGEAEQAWGQAVEVSGGVGGVAGDVVRVCGEARRAVRRLVEGAGAGMEMEDEQQRRDKEQAEGLRREVLDRVVARHGGGHGQTSQLV